MLVSRISRRVLAEHHIALSDSFVGKNQCPGGDSNVGIIWTGLSVEKSVQRCVDLLREQSQHELQSSDGQGWPQVVVEGHLGTKFAYIREHLEYVPILMSVHIAIYQLPLQIHNL